MDLTDAELSFLADESGPTIRRLVAELRRMRRERADFLANMAQSSSTTVQSGGASPRLVDPVGATYR